MWLCILVRREQRVKARDLHQAQNSHRADSRPAQHVAAEKLQAVSASKPSTAPNAMGKKSKRRGGGGGVGKKNGGALNSRDRSDGDQLTASGGTLATADTDTFSAEEAEALLRVPRPSSFKGIISTNDAPNKCVFCFSDLVGVRFVRCCGKTCCPDCNNSPGQILDLRGQYRCKFCNALVSKRTVILKHEAQLGKPWAQYILGAHILVNEPTESLCWLRKAARAGNPYAFNEFAKIFLGGKGINRDLRLARSFAEKVRSLHPGIRLWRNRRLLDIAKAHIDDGEENEANDILLSITRETDEIALDAQLCANVAALISEDKVSAEMYARSFCYGRIESALLASIQFSYCEKHALSKLWLDVACRSKALYDSVKVASTGETIGWADYDSYRNDTRSKLREMRNSCGGCGATLEGETRKYCRCCRTSCYCNEDCQKQHWENRHREECKEVEEDMRKILFAIRLGRFDSLCKSASK